MFTGIIESIGVVTNLEKIDGNLHIEMESKISNQLKIDQSVSHNGVCLTVVSTDEKRYIVTAIAETLSKTNLSDLQVGNSVNLERAMKLGDRLDGHMVQGHVDQIARCTSIKETDGSWVFSFDYGENTENIVVEKGSITLNGVSLTVFNTIGNSFTVAIIPYTYENTNLKYIKKGDAVNIEFDIIGKYAAKLMIGYLKN